MSALAYGDSHNVHVPERLSIRTPEQRLLVFMLCDALEIAVLGKNAYRASQGDIQAAKEWLESQSERPFGKKWTLHMLGADDDKKLSRPEPTMRKRLSGRTGGVNLVARRRA